jgi:hypothetical protein
MAILALNEDGFVIARVAEDDRRRRSMRARKIRGVEPNAATRRIEREEGVVHASNLTEMGMQGWNAEADAVIIQVTPIGPPQPVVSLRTRRWNVP